MRPGRFGAVPYAMNAAGEAETYVYGDIPELRVDASADDEDDYQMVLEWLREQRRHYRGWWSSEGLWRGGCDESAR